MADILLGELGSPFAAQQIAELTTPEDHAHAETFRRLQRRNQSLLGRALLRRLLTRKTGLDGCEWMISSVSGVSVRHPNFQAPLFASISHSGTAATAVLSVDGPTGVDIEQISNKRDMAKILRGLMPEKAEAPQDIADRYAVWTMYEAWLKTSITPIAHQIPDEILRAMRQTELGSYIQLTIGGTPYRFDVVRLPKFALCLCQRG